MSDQLTNFLMKYVGDKERVSILERMVRSYGLSDKKIETLKKFITAELREGKSQENYSMIFFSIVALSEQYMLNTVVTILADSIRRNFNLVSLLKYLEPDYSIEYFVNKVECSEDVGVCYNFSGMVLDAKEVVDNFSEGDFEIVYVEKKNEDCPVGIVRKMRDGIIFDDDTCYTCPYFIPTCLLKLACEFVISKDENLLREVRDFVYKRILFLWFPVRDEKINL